MPRLRHLLAFGVTSFVFAIAANAQDTAPAPAAPATGAAPARPAALADFEAYLDATRKQFDVPGIAVAIVKDGKVVLELGSGVRKLGDPAKVDAHTQFAIASNTKAFTAASLAILADEKKLDMNDRVIDRLPWFQMSDPYVTREMRVRDLLAHRSGLSLGAGDLLYWPATTYTTKEVVQRLRYVPLTNSFRAEYAYDNILFAVAGLVIEQVSGKSWSDFVRERIFQPLGMTESQTSAPSHVAAGDDIATGHAKFDFKDLKPVPPMSWSNNPSAGGIYSSVHDLSKWMTMQLAGGAYTDASGKAQRLFSEKRQAEMWSLITPIRISEPSVPELAPAKPNFSGYGEGWFVSDYRGHKLVWHTGGWPGMVSRLTMVPDLRLGVVVLTNQESGAAFQAVTMRALDAFMDAPVKDWIAAYAASVKKAEGNADDSMKKHEAARMKGAKPSLPLDGYAGTYRDPWYGDVKVAKQGGKLVMSFTKTAQLTGTLEPWQHDTFVAHWDDRSLNGDAFVNFVLDPDGKVREVRMEPVSPLTDFSFDFQDLRLAPVP
ncbi:CubicO group peptidase, beta-lactamase class C family [Luteibacter sp. UNC138MFCol5.1]|uniref:serine hydrolase n=1 Tax=Luteibacter sp. UNC138MFCol5.1 TaxID=1502774 RepID=UPI0008D1C588|nr:serine hydrolase [Luteibacter sp. UNC138MFCol5.1]SEO55424.1 CubicO group peptidase, beta-lactamase class C family [Luteibacter sp. UNC138MFCol5.1]